MKYLVTCVERLEYVVEVEADSFEEASDKAVDVAINGNAEAYEDDIYVVSLDREDGEWQLGGAI